jgi:hypothetical protein
MLSGYRKPVEPQKPGYQKTWAITLAEICVDKNLSCHVDRIHHGARLGDLLGC